MVPGGDRSVRQRPLKPRQPGVLHLIPRRATLRGLVLAAPRANRYVPQSPARGPVPLAGLAEITRLVYVIIVAGGRAQTHTHTKPRARGLRKRESEKRRGAVRQEAENLLVAELGVLGVAPWALHRAAGPWQLGLRLRTPLGCRWCRPASPASPVTGLRTAPATLLSGLLPPLRVLGGGPTLAARALARGRAHPAALPDPLLQSRRLLRPRPGALGDDDGLLLLVLLHALPWEFTRASLAVLSLSLSLSLARSLAALFLCACARARLCMSPSQDNIWASSSRCSALAPRPRARPRLVRSPLLRRSCPSPRDTIWIERFSTHHQLFDPFFGPESRNRRATTRLLVRIIATLHLLQDGPGYGAGSGPASTLSRSIC